MDSQALVEKDDVFSDLSKLNMKESDCDMFFKVHLSDSTTPQKKAEQSKSKPLILYRSSDGSYCCPACNKTFASRSATFRHYRNHTGKHPYTCSLCHKNFASKASVDSHQLRVHNFNTDSALSCSECGKLFVRRSALEVHLKIHSSDKPFHCEQCGKSFTQKVSRDIHLAKHTGKYDYQCSTCEKSFASQAKLNSHSFVHKTPRFTCELCGHHFVRHDTLTVHQRTHTGEHPFQCSACSRTFLSQSKLVTHCQIHNEVPQYRCTCCRAQFKQKTGLVAHMRRLHNVKKSSRSDSHPCKEATHTSPEIFTSLRSDQLTIPVATEQPGHIDYNSTAVIPQPKCFLCPHCGKEFRKKQSLQLHERMHNISQSAKPMVHACHLCTKSFVQMSKLTAHIRTHLEEPPYQCDICGKRFHRKDVYNNHIFLHTNERPYSCAHCGKAFASKFNLRVHLNTHSASSRTNHHTVIELQCNDCGKKFKHKKTYTLHRKSHLGDFAFTCVTCGKKFMKKSHFEGHLRSHTSDRPFQCRTCGRRFKERKHCREHARKAHPNTFSLASLFASITNEDAQMDHISDILCPAATTTVQEREDSSVLNVPGLPDQLQPTLSEVSETTPTHGLDTSYLLGSHVNLNETSITIPTPMPSLVFSPLEPMLEEIEISSTTDYLLSSSQTALEKNTSCQVEMSQSTISLTILSGEDTNSVLTQSLET